MDVEDPAPAEPGIFLPNINPQRCFRTLNASIPDADLDFLGDQCEFVLANNFRPLLVFSTEDQCTWRQPYWAAKVFPNYSRPIVRIAYMPAYLQDCGAYGHAGDSEFITVEIEWVESSQHWAFRGMWLSAHFGTGPWDHSSWIAPGATMFPDKPLGFPYVWVSINKHANYHSVSACNASQYQISSWDQCSFNFSYQRFDVVSGRNVGSRFQDLVGCVFLEGSSYNRCESFYTRRPFSGWQIIDPTQGETPYRDILIGDHFEYLAQDGGPDPFNLPSPVYSTAIIYGPGVVPPDRSCQWYASASNIDEPRRYEWRINNATVGTDQTFAYSSSQSFTMELVVWNETTFQGASTTRTITVTDGAECSVELLTG